MKFPKSALKPQADNLNFFCHARRNGTSDRERVRQRLALITPSLVLILPHLPPALSDPSVRNVRCGIELKPEVVSFHFGFPTNPYRPSQGRGLQDLQLRDDRSQRRAGLRTTARMRSLRKGSRRWPSRMF